MAERQELVVIAQIAGAHGVRGDMKVRSFTDDVEACFDYGPLMGADGAILVTPIASRWQKANLFIVQTEEDLTREEWEALKGTDLHVYRDALPPPDEDEFYIEDLIGCRLVHQDGRDLGLVRHVHNFGADDLLDLEGPRGEAWMLAFTRENVSSVDLAARQLIASPEEDLLPKSLQREDHLSDDDSDKP